MKQRVITAVIAIVGLLVVLFALPPIVAILLVAAIMLAGAWEWSAFLKTEGKGVRIAYVLLLGALLAAAAFMLEAVREPVLLTGIVWWVCALIWTFFYPTPVPAALAWVGGILMIVPLFTALLTLLEVSPQVLLFMLLIVWVADSGAFFAGKMFGRVKLAPAISPGKTWEGVIGGLVAVALLAVGVGTYAELDLLSFVPFCLACGSLSIVGDLTVSMFKRDVGIKDSGTLFPGHGGVLDRVDSIAAAGPLFALGMSWAGVR